MHTEKSKAGGVFTVQCFDAAGNLKWETEEHNLVVNEGLKYMNDTFFRGSAYTAAWYLGLVAGPAASNTYSANDTLASHAGWTEFTNYSGNRGSLVLDAATLADPSVATNSTALSFTITGGGGVVAGAFLANVDTGTSGTLFSVSNFLSPGDRTVVAGDTLNVTYAFSLDAV